MVRIVAFCIGLMITLPAAWADAWKDCEQGEDRDLSIKGCTEFITKGDQTKQNLAVAYHNRGNGYGLKGEFDRAIADYTKAIELDPTFAVAYNNRGAAYESKEAHDEAIADYTRAIELAPNFALPYSYRGQTYEQKGEKDLAIADYKKAMDLDPNLADAQNGLKRLGGTP